MSADTSSTQQVIKQGTARSIDWRLKVYRFGNTATNVKSRVYQIGLASQGLPKKV